MKFPLNSHKEIFIKKHRFLGFFSDGFSPEPPNPNKGFDNLRRSLLHGLAVLLVGILLNTCVIGTV